MLRSNEQDETFELEAVTRDRIPEVTYHYHEFREPLVDQNF